MPEKSHEKKKNIHMDFRIFLSLKVNNNVKRKNTGKPR